MAYRKGITLKLGLITVPVDINSGVDKEPANHIVCEGKEGAPHEPTQVKQRTACPRLDCDNDDASTFRLVADAAGGAVSLTREEIAEARAAAVGDSNKVIYLSSHPVDQVRANTIPNGSVYFLTPSNPYVAQQVDYFKDAMICHPEMAFLGTFSPSGRPNLYEFRMFGESIIMTQLARTQDIKVLDQPLGGNSDAYRQQMDAIVTGSATDYDPLEFADTVKARMAALTATKTPVGGVVLTKPSRSAAAAPVVDFAAQMQATLDAMVNSGVPAEGLKPVAKKAAAKRAPRKPKAA